VVQTKRKKKRPSVILYRDHGEKELLRTSVRGQEKKGGLRRKLSVKQGVEKKKKNMQLEGAESQNVA